MRQTAALQRKIHDLTSLQMEVNRWKLTGKKIVFTNGVFDLLHAGHLSSLNEAAGYGDVLIVAVNSDSSVKKLKGDSRPVMDERTRASLLASLAATDAVIIFSDDTPADTIRAILPDVLVKGGDYKVGDIAGAKEVLANGGEVILAKIVDGISTTNIISKLNS